MGLDITAASKINWKEAYTEEEVYQFNSDAPSIADMLHEKVNAIRVWVASFPERADGVVPSNAIDGRDYFKVDGEKLNFRAGSYSGYNNWRDELSLLALKVPAESVWHNPKFLGQPFQELIEFSDCEGVIGPKTSAKLYKDFCDFHAAALIHAQTIGDGDWWLDKYELWMRAFQLAADGGAVQFH